MLGWKTVGFGFGLVLLNVFTHVIVAWMPKPTAALSGLLAVYKPKQWTSNDVVQKVKGVIQHAQNKQLIKVGHGGTLDPMAEGVVVIGVGSGTKKLDSYLSGKKTYCATATFGTATNTLDATGTVVLSKDCSFLKRDQIEAKLSLFTGSIQQTPPMFSALKSKGVRLYELARKGIEISRPPRTVFVHKLVIEKDFLPKSMVFHIECDGGFYVRSFIDDLATSVDACAHMSELVRIQQGPFWTKDCLRVEELSIENISSRLVCV
jgi:tRNA pseudouridine55 synthase